MALATVAVEREFTSDEAVILRPFDGIGVPAVMTAVALVYSSVVTDSSATNCISSPSRGFRYFDAPPDTATTVLYAGSDQRELSRRFRSARRVSTVDVALGMRGASEDVTI